ncbi:MAG: EAL domain-containing protein [Coxiellaceae bacterium]|nr:EAL domain-containing protein [Coxiellaceae bacterium]
MNGQNNKIQKERRASIKGKTADSGLAKILVVDDRPENLIAMAKVLKPLDVEVIKANSGNEALSLTFDHDFSVILLDVQMPEMDGFEVASYLRLQEKTNKIPIIFVTAISKDQKHVFEGYELGAVDYLFKPIEQKVLLSKVNVFIELYNERRNQLKELVKQLENTQDELLSSNQELKLLSSRDPLTSLPNRRQLEEETQRMIDANNDEQMFALLLVDLDNFKPINDTLGHDIGDLVLQEVSNRLLSSVREEDFVSRLGGDEFAILLNYIDDDSIASKIAKKIINEINKVFIVDGKKLHVGACVGTACFPLAGSSFKELTKHADIALYQAKAKGGNVNRFYTEQLNKKQERRSELEKALHFAVANDELYLEYQPIVNLNTKEVIGVEALLRWVHPQLGLISPAEFIPLSEEIGLSNNIGSWVLLHTSQQFNLWYAAGYTSMQFSLNLSVCQLLEEGLVDTFEVLYKDLDISLSHVTLEVTESAIMLQESLAIKVLERLSNLGFKISIDDFGTGYSSLGRLQKMPIDVLKIDKSFIDNVGQDGDDVIVNAVIGLAKNLNLDVVAEGVETKNQEAFLIQNKCEMAQGYLYSKPVKPEKITSLLKSREYRRE